MLVAGQPYSEFGCDIPDGYVEPVPAAYEALIEYAQRGVKLAAIVDPSDKLGIAAYYGRVGRVLHVLDTIATHELAGLPLSDAEKRWLGMVAEMGQDRSVDTTGFPPIYSGWYFSTSRTAARDDGLRSGRFIADYFTSPSDGVAYLGATEPRMGVFVIDAGGPARVAVGPVARGYELHTPVGKRLTDGDAATTTVVEPWAASYTLAAPAPRPHMLRVSVDEHGKVTVTTDRALGAATIRILDHHRVPIASKQGKLVDGDTVFEFNTRKQVGAVYVEIGAFRDWIVADAYDHIENAGWGERPQ